MCLSSPHFRQLRHIHPNPQQAIASGLLVTTMLMRSPTSHIIKKITRNIGSRYVLHANSSRAKPLSLSGIQNKFSRGGSRPYRGRGRGSRGGYSGNHPSNQRHYFPPPTEGWGNGWSTATSTTPLAAPASTQVPTPHSISVPDSYHSQGYAPPPQSPHTSHSYPHPITSSPTHSRPHPHAHLHTAQPISPVLATVPSSSQQTRHHQGAHPQVYEHEHARPRDHPQPPPRLHERRPALSPAPNPQAADDGHRPGGHPQVYEHEKARDPQPPPPPRSHERRPAPAPAPQAADDGYRQGSHPQDYDHKHARPRDHPQPSSPPPPRSHEWRPAPVPAPAPQAQAADDGYRETRYADSYAVYSPAPSDEQVRWMSTPTPSESVGGQQRRHSPSQSRGSSPSRSYVGHSRHTDEVRGGRR
ncbi:hypothetical protein DFH94DRAFT_54865 [Russula ochroleuca]|uniref:Uncharacterized protein n=1 Tax=Russula ochroleuca TaxID=152965 RepID=A0A9P5MTK9_9AGAM|nr:hypothetical protein DFH94DRAFT_54865 [Russula ochroleuca]